MIQTRIYDPNLDLDRKITALKELKRADNAVNYRNSVMSGKVKRGTHKEKIEKLNEWARKKGLPDRKPAVCPKCKHNMNAHQAEMQIKNKREGGVECMACIMGYKRKVWPKKI